MQAKDVEHTVVYGYSNESIKAALEAAEANAAEANAEGKDTTSICNEWRGSHWDCYDTSGGDY